MTVSVSEFDTVLKQTAAGQAQSKAGKVTVDLLPAGLFPALPGAVLPFRLPGNIFAGTIAQRPDWAWMTP